MDSKDLVKLVEFYATKGRDEPKNTAQVEVLSRHRMIFAEIDEAGNGEYVCLQCGRPRRFARDPQSGGFHEVTAGKKSHPCLNVALLLLMLAFLCILCPICLWIGSLIVVAGY
jgi:hypothetical protein